MGASRAKLFITIVTEGCVLTLIGSCLGLLMGHGVLIVLATVVEQTGKAGITGMVFYWQEWIILVGSLLLGLLCATIPAIQAYRTDIAEVLSGA
jgi:putative ABC transport system permease protein